MTTNSDKISQLYQISSENGRQFSYFLLAAAGAAIAFSIQSTLNQRLGWQHLPIGAAVAAWAASFYCGCRHLLEANSLVGSNIGYLEICSKMQNNLQNGDKNAKDLEQKMKLDMEKWSSRAAIWGKWQNWFIYIGGMAFISWHIIGMVIHNT